MPSITVEPFTSAVLVSNVDRVSSLGVIHEGPTLLARGRATVSALQSRKQTIGLVDVPKSPSFATVDQLIKILSVPQESAIELATCWKLAAQWRKIAS
jgi:hypothetical protein